MSTCTTTVNVHVDAHVIVDLVVHRPGECRKCGTAGVPVLRELRDLVNGTPTRTLEKTATNRNRFFVTGIAKTCGLGVPHALGDSAKVFLSHGPRRVSVSWW
jgi:hypothetical protein